MAANRMLIWMLLLALPGCATQSSVKLADAVRWQRIAMADVIYVGETHDSVADHRFQLEIIGGMARRGIPFAVGWEMFDITQQSVLDQWQRGAIKTRELFARTGFDQGWAKHSPLYRRILERTRRRGIPNIALNAPRTITRKIARGQALNSAEQKLLPTGYRASEEAFSHFSSQIGIHPGLKAAETRRYFAAQSAWDATMAESIIVYRRRHPEAKLVVLCGRGHLSGGFGIPYFVRQKSPLIQFILFPASGPRLRLPPI